MTFIRPDNEGGWGVGVPPQGWVGKEHLLSGLLARLQPSWWYNWGPFIGPFDASPGYLPMIWSGDELGWERTREAMASHPNRVWLVMNEPHIVDQSNKTPAQVFEITKRFLRLAGDVGVTGQYAAYGVDMSPEGILWATDYARLHRQHFYHRAHAYLHWHVYAADRSEWDAMWLRFDAWYRVWGADTPVIITEVGARDRGLESQKRIMDLAREKLETDPRVVGVAWFVASRSPGGVFPNAALSAYDSATETMKLTTLGEYWISLKN